jgi:hypothetical protein
MQRKFNSAWLEVLFCIFLAGVIMGGLKLFGYLNIAVIMLPVMLLLFGARTVFPNTSAGIFHPFPKLEIKHHPAPPTRS